MEGQFEKKEISQKSAYRQSFLYNEISDTERSQIDWAEKEGYLKKRLSGNFLDVEFLPIRDLSKVPHLLMHVTHSEVLPSIMRGGVVL